MKCRGADSGTGTGSGALCTAQCTVCSVLHVTGTLNQISLPKFLKHLPSGLIEILMEILMRIMMGI